ncbi:MAG: radical SAM protein [Candidatus Hermodarchaeota archaeon]
MIDFSEFMKKENIDEFVYQAYNLRLEHFGTTLAVSYPSPRFPSISVTGSSCAMNCQYCNKKYLEHMIPARSPEALLAICEDLDKKQAKGCLISGGYTSKGVVPLDPFFESIRMIKETTNLIINVHPGLVSLDQAQKMKEIGVDVISLDLIGSQEVITEVIGLDASPEDYFRTLDNLLSVGLEVVPHIGLGFHYGKISGVEEALKICFERDIKLLVFVILIPTKGTPMEKYRSPGSDLIQKIITWTRLQKPQMELSLGCMRPRDLDIDKRALVAGINRIAVPSRRIINFSKEIGYQIEKIEACCAV